MSSAAGEIADRGQQKLYNAQNKQNGTILLRVNFSKLVYYFQLILRTRINHEISN